MSTLVDKSRPKSASTGLSIPNLNTRFDELTESQIDQVNILSCMWSGQDCEDLRRGMFDAGFRPIFDALLDRKYNGLDISGMLERLCPQYDQMDFEPALVSILQYPSNAGIDFYVRRHREKRRKDKLKFELQGLIHEIDDISEAELQSRVATLAETDRKPQRLTIKQLRRAFPKMYDPVIHGLVRECETFNIVASTKVGKTWLGYHLLLCVVTGRPFLGRHLTVPGKVLLFDLELAPPTIWNRIDTVAEAMEIPKEDYEDQIEVEALRGNWKDIYQIAAECYHTDAKLILIDALYRTFPKNMKENENAALTEVYNTIDALAQRVKAAVGCIHHATKGNQADKSVTDMGSGGGSQSRAVDCHAVLRPHEEDNCAVLEAALRSFAPIEPIPIRWEFPLWKFDDSLDPLALQRAKTRGETKQAQNDREGMNKVLNAFERLKAKELTRGQIRKQIGAGNDRTNKLIGQLLESEQIVYVRTEQLRNGTETDVFRVNSLKTQSDGTDCQ